MITHRTSFLMYRPLYGVPFYKIILASVYMSHDQLAKRIFR